MTTAASEGDTRPVAGCIDTPDGTTAVARGPLLVSGWAYEAEDPVSRIELVLGGQLLGRAGLCRPRPDVADALHDADAEVAGFELLADLTGLELGDEEQLSAVVTLFSGTTGRLRRRTLRIATGGDSGRPPAENERAPAVPRPTKPPPRSSRPLRVLWHERSFGHGGSQLRLRETIEYLAARGGFSSTVVAPGEGPLRRELEQAGATTFEVPPTSLSDLGAYEKAVAAITTVAEAGFDIAVGWTLTSFPVIEVAARLGLSSIWRVGEGEPLRVVARWMLDELDPAVEERARTAAAASSLVLCKSIAARDAMTADGFEGSFAVQWAGVDVEGAREYCARVDKGRAREALGLPGDRRILLLPAMIWSPKGQLPLVTALARAKTRHRLLCALVGTPYDPYLDLILRQVERHGLGESVRLVPFQPDVRPWMRAADAGLCAAESESLPTSVLEEMAFGLPVLSTRVGDVPHVLGHGAGWLCEPNDLAALVEGLELVAAASDEELETLGAAGAHHVEQFHDRRTTDAQLAELLVSISGGSRPDWLEVDSCNSSQLCRRL